MVVFILHILNYLQNFAVIFLSMIAFFLPFIAVFAWRNREAMRGKRPHFNYFMERFFMSAEANWLVFAWALAEATVWFIIPEFLLMLLIFMKIHRKFDLVKYDILGTIAGTLLGLLWRLSDSGFLRLPYIRPRMLEQVDIWFQQHGLLGLLYQPFSGVPYKVFIHQADQYHFFILWFLIIAIFARMVRYLIIYEATKALYPLVHHFVRKHYAWLFVIAIAIFTFLLLHVVDVYGS